MTKAECIEALYGQALQAEQMVGCADQMNSLFILIVALMAGVAVLFLLLVSMLLLK